MKIVIDISKDRYDEIMSMDWKNCRLIFDEEIRAIHDGKAIEQDPCDDEYIKVPKKVLKYRTAGMVAYNAEWLKNHFDIERAVICGEQEPCEDAISRRDMALNIVSFYNKATGKKKTLDFLCKCVEGLPSVQPKTGWIPVSERLPDNDCECWVTVTIGGGMRNIVHSCNYTSDLYDVDEYYFINRKGESGFYNYDSEYGYYEIYDVIAWMPYFEPKPYKAESEDKE